MEWEFSKPSYENDNLQHLCVPFVEIIKKTLHKYAYQASTEQTRQTNHRHNLQILWKRLSKSDNHFIEDSPPQAPPAETGSGAKTTTRRSIKLISLFTTLKFPRPTSPCLLLCRQENPFRSTRFLITSLKLLEKITSTATTTTERKRKATVNALPGKGASLFNFAGKICSNGKSFCDRLCECFLGSFLLICVVFGWFYKTWFRASCGKIFAGKKYERTFSRVACASPLIEH